MSSAAERGASFIDRRIIPADFNWQDYDVTEERHKVRPASDYTEEVLRLFGDSQEPIGALWPWNKMNDRGMRFRPGETTIYAGINGNRKSMITTQIALNLMRQDQPCLIASFEMQPRMTLKRMNQQAAGSGSPSDEYIRALSRWSDGRLWVYDLLGSCAPRQMLAVARYAITELGVKHIFVDSLMKVVKGTDDYNGQKDFIAGLCSMSLSNGVHSHLVAHARKGRDVTAGIDKWDIKGASEIADQVDNVILVNKKDDAKGEEPNQWLDIAKQRNGEFEGKVGLHFDVSSLSFAEAPGRRWVGVPIPGDPL